MDVSFPNTPYVYRLIEDIEGGMIGYELYRLEDGKEILNAQVFYWDASGQFFVETFNEDVPLVILEKLICEAKKLVPSYRQQY